MTHVIKADGSIKQSGTSSGAAPIDATYVTLTTNGTLTDERVLTAGEGIDLTDAGAGSTITISGEDATSANKGIATFNSADFDVTSGDVTLKAASVAVGDLANGTAGQLITWSAAGAATTVATGTATHVLTSNGAGAAPTFQAASGGGSFVLISAAAASSSSSVDFEGLDSTYAAYMFTWDSVVPVTDAANLHVRVGTGATPTYQTGSVYAWSIVYDNDAAASGFTQSASDTSIKLLNSCGNAANEVGNGKLMIYNPSTTAGYHSLNFETGFTNSVTATIFYNGQGTYLSSTAVTAIRFFMTTGNISSGNFYCYGLKAT